ncbi:MAG: SIS domain-containing protein [Planctomycetes bacterium]|nr:SIS domain-containing protein [Planctomycetota bacterium]
MNESILHQINEAADTLRSLADHTAAIEAIADRIVTSLSAHGTLYLCGNGGSAADAEHVAAEFVGRFLMERRPLPAVALTCNGPLLTAIGNDYDYADIFARQVRAHATPRDCVIGISTSGRSPNVLKALADGRAAGATTIGMTGAGGHRLAELCDACLLVPATHTPRIQEAQLLAWHLICDLVDRTLFSPAPPQR